MRAVIAVAACPLVPPGCGGGAEGGAKRSGRLGFVRIDARTRAAARVRATVTASSQGEPYKIKALGPERLDLALSDGTIVATQDGGRRWKETFRP
jgi:hypothetical protein